MRKDLNFSLMIAAATIPSVPSQCCSCSTGLTWWWWRCWGLGCFAAGRTACPRNSCRCCNGSSSCWCAGWAIRWWPGFSMKLADLDEFWSLMDGVSGAGAAGVRYFFGLKPDVCRKAGQEQFFQGGEYYLGMVSGMVRFACVLLFAAGAAERAGFSRRRKLRPRTPPTSRVSAAACLRGNYFPHVFTVQDWVFEKSFTGPASRITSDAADQLHARPTPATTRPRRRRRRL